MALERLQALALFWVPQDDAPVLPAAREKLAVKTPGDGEDRGAAIFSNVREHICCGHASPPVSGGKRERHAVLNNAKYATFRKKQSPVALERLQALAC